MGFDVSQVTSDQTHYGSFICPLDNNLVYLESAVVVPTASERVFNQKSLVDKALKCIDEGLPILRIPSCRLDLKLLTAADENQNGSSHGPRLQVNETTWIEAGMLKDLQPLAYRCLEMVQVRCKQPGSSDHWIGNYGDLPSKLLAENDRYSDSPATSSIQRGSGPPVSNRELSSGSREEAVSTLYDAGAEVGERANVGVTTRGTGAHHKRMVDAALVKKIPPKSAGGALEAGNAGTGSDSIVADNDYDPEELKRAMDRCDKLKKQANAKFNRADVDGARVLYSEGLALLSDFPLQVGPNASEGEERDENGKKTENEIIQEVRIMVASLYSNRAVTFYRERILQPSVEDCNKSLELDSKSEKTYIRKWRALDAMGERDQALACLEEGVKELPTSTKLMDQLRKSLAPPSADGGSGIRPSDRSIASMSHAFNANATVVSGKFGQQEMDISVAGDPNHNVLERAERLKKQANAKFNKGDIDAARTLYSDALGCIPTQGFYSRGVKSLLSELYSNRAVTYYRNKEYQESLEDCEQAIEKNPEAEKSYIRKARALVGLERHMDASKCLQDAHKLFPTSKKIKEELNKIVDQRDAYNGGRAGVGSSNDSVDHQGSVGSLSNFYPNSHANTGGQTLSTGREELTYAEDIELSDKLKRNANAKFNRGDVAGARLLYTEAMGCLPNDRENEIVRACLASLYANRAVTYYREQEYVQSIRDCDHSIELDSKGEKPYSRKARALASMERYDEAILTLEEGKRHVPGSDKLEDELVKIRQEFGASTAIIGEESAADEDASENDVTTQASSVADNNESSNSFFVPPGGVMMDSVPEGKSQDFDLPTKIDPEEFERAEKLKKQANAKLNKGDVAGARVLYGEGLACMPPGGEKSTEGRELAANLYANRAVTYFREKKFRETVNDCNKAVEFDPKHEKSYIRKWRALMALGSFDDALRCLESALKELPESERLNEELTNATEERELLNTVNEMIANHEYQQAHDSLEDIVKTSDNVTLWLASARADSCLGNTESALDRIEKVLMFNPKHAEALRVRGFATFLSGDMENGVNLLKESLEGDIEDTDNRHASGMLNGCQLKMNTFHKGQARVKRGRSREAVELFTSIMKEGEDRIPHNAPLYGILLTERAEANLLSDQHEAALEDCAEAISLKQDNLAAWTVKIEVYYALGRLQEARDELAVARKTWGARNETIEDAYKKTDFELRLRKVDDELRFLVETVEDGKAYSDEAGILHMNHSQRQNRSDSANIASSRNMRPASPMKRSSDHNGHANKRAQSRGKKEGFKFFKSSSRERGGGRTNGQ